MENLVPLGTGNSRLMKSNIPASTTLAQLIQMLNNGTFPYDIGPLNPAGISQQGTPLNKATLWKDATAALFGLGVDSVPDDGFALLSRLNSGLGNEYLWEKTKVKTTFEYENRTNTSVSVGSSLWISNSVELVGGVVTMVSPQKLTVEASGDFVAKLTNVYLTTTGVFQNPWFCTSAGYSGISVTLYYYSTVKAVTTIESFGYVNSPDEDAYPPSIPDGYEYAALGQLGAKTQIYTGSYTGTGTYGSSNPNTLTFPFEPKLVIVTGRTNTTSDYQSMGIFVQGAQWTFGAGAGTALNTTVSRGNNGANQITWNGNTISWYTLCTATTANYRPAAQLNSSGRTYYYIAIG